jgi:hypothetical protein
MNRRWTYGAFVGCLLIAVALPAQQPTGMLSPTRGFRLTYDGVPDGVNDADGTIVRTVGPQNAFQAQFGNLICNGQGSFYADGLTGGLGRIDQFGRGAGTEVTATDLDMSDAQPRPTRGHYDELGQGVVTGDFELIDDDGNHKYDRATVVGNNPRGGVQVDLDLVPADVEGDPDPDYVTLSSLEPFNFFGLNCHEPVPGAPTGTEYTQIWLPLATDLDGDAAVIGDLDGDDIADPDLFWGPKLQFGPEPPPSVLEVPAISRLGVALLALALLAVGVRSLRRRTSAAG